MANEQNLIPNSERTPSELREMTRKGGINSGKARREKRDLREKMKLWLDTEVGTDKNGEPLTGADLMVKVAAKEMRDGNPKYWELIRDTAGFKPVEKVMVSEIDQEIIDVVERQVLGDDTQNET